MRAVFIVRIYTSGINNDSTTGRTTQNDRQKIDGVFPGTYSIWVDLVRNGARPTPSTGRKERASLPGFNSRIGMGPASKCRQALARDSCARLLPRDAAWPLLPL